MNETPTTVKEWVGLVVTTKGEQFGDGRWWPPGVEGVVVGRAQDRLAVAFRPCGCCGDKPVTDFLTRDLEPVRRVLAPPPARERYLDSDTARRAAWPELAQDAGAWRRLEAFLAASPSTPLFAAELRIGVGDAGGVGVPGDDLVVTRADLLALLAPHRARRGVK